MDKAAEFAMANTAGERALYADQANRNENGKVVCERVRCSMQCRGHAYTLMGRWIRSGWPV